MKRHTARSSVKRRDVWEVLRFETAAELHYAAAFFKAGFKFNAKELNIVVNGMRNLSGIGYRSDWNLDNRPAPNSFSVDAAKEEDGSGYLLSIRSKGAGHSLRTNHQAEKDLADKLGYQIGYTKCEIKRTWVPKGNYFAIPINDIKTIYDALGAHFEPQEFLNAFKKIGHTQPHADKTIRYTHSIEIMNENKVVATLDFDLIHSIVTGQKKTEKVEFHNYAIENDHWTGPAKLNNGRPQAVHLVLTIKTDAKRTFDPLLAARLQELGMRVETAIQKTIPKPMAVKAKRTRPEII